MTAYLVKMHRFFNEFDNHGCASQGEFDTKPFVGHVIGLNTTKELALGERRRRSGASAMGVRRDSRFCVRRMALLP